VLKSLEITDEKELEQLDQKQCILQLAQEAAAAAMFNNPATVKV
jgi:hypothetical protein